METMLGIHLTGFNVHAVRFHERHKIVIRVCTAKCLDRFLEPCRWVLYAQVSKPIGGSQGTWHLRELHRAPAIDLRRQHRASRKWCSSAVVLQTGLVIVDHLAAVYFVEVVIAEPFLV